MNLLKQLQAQLQITLSDFIADNPAPYVAMLKPTQDPRHGDYQLNCAMSLAKTLGRNPRSVAKEIVDRITIGPLIGHAEVAGPGFINLRLSDAWLATSMADIARSDRLGVDQTERPRGIVIDFSSPNVAKPLHVGHLRSTIIGDSLARLLRFLGHRVITDNHLGDWGTQFGILLYGYKHFRDEQALQRDPVQEMNRLYVQVRNLMKGADDDGTEDLTNPIADAARRETALLHAGDPENARLWRMFMPWCRQEIDQIYERLGVHFDYCFGESFYNSQLADVVRELQDRGIAQPSEGAVVVFLGADEPPALIRKKDGAFTYTTTDLATIHYRVVNWKADGIFYVVDSRQALHFKSLFEISRRWGFESVELQHISFGSVLGPDRKPIRTREGGATELGRLLDEAVERGAQIYEKSIADRGSQGIPVPNIDEAERQKIAEVVGIGAVKYADLSQNRTSDYIFNWDKMLAMDGNTATYMQYAYARNRSIFRKGEIEPNQFRTNPPNVLLQKPQERALTLQLLRFSEALDAAAADYRPSAITSFLWDLAKTYNGFFESCPVLQANSEELRQSRLLLCDLTARVIAKGLELLGIHTIERM